MTPTRLVLALALGTAGLVVAARPAEACSPPPPVSRSALRTPATDLPLNGQIRVSFDGVIEGGLADPRLDVSLRPVGGAPVAAQVALVPGGPFAVLTFAVLTPDAPLAPSTTYEVLTRFPVDGCTGTCPTDAPVVIGTVTTGTISDATPPTFAGIDGSTEGYFETCGGSSCCGPYEARHFDLTWSQATDDVGVAAYRVYRVGAGGARELVLETPSTRARGVAMCEGFGQVLFTDFQGAGTFVVTAVDLAGHEDDNAVMRTVAPSCTPDPIDAGSTDAGPMDAGDASLDKDGSGCGCTVGAAPMGPARAAGLFALAGLLALVGRRRGRR